MKRFFLFLLFAFCLVLFLILGINFIVVKSTKNQILTLEELAQISDIDAILVLGCQVKNNQTPSAMLEDRLNTGISLYEYGVAPKLIMSGDHRTKEYNEVQVMKDYAKEKGILSSDIFMDHAGLNTYDSVYRAQYIFQAKKVVIVSQSYHLYRALMIANHLGLEAYGVSSDTVTYRGQGYREIREILARNKDFFLSLLRLKPTILGEVIPVSSNGDFTNDVLVFVKELFLPINSFFVIIRICSRSSVG